jgi:hypothetical protein
MDWLIWKECMCELTNDMMKKMKRSWTNYLNVKLTSVENESKVNQL